MTSIRYSTDVNSSWRRNADRFEPRVCTTRACLETFKISAGVRAGQVQYFATELPVFLDLRFRLRRSPTELAMLFAGVDDLLHCLFESRVIELQMNAQLRTQIRVAVSNHVDAID